MSQLRAAAPAGNGREIRVGLADCPFGRLLVGATARGVCFLGFAEPDEALLADLRRRFPTAAITRDDRSLADTVEAVLAFLDAPRAALDLRLDLHGTAFQLRVWQTLCLIPPGETRTYTQLAEMVGNGNAIRAVGRCCATNPVSLAVPCHRVVGRSGSLTGYRWGVARKQALLEWERAATRSGTPDQAIMAGLLSPPPR